MILNANTGSHDFYQSAKRGKKRKASLPVDAGKQTLQANPEGSLDQKLEWMRRKQAAKKHPRDACNIPVDPALLRAALKKCETTEGDGQ